MRNYYSGFHAASWWNVYFILIFLLAVNSLINFEPALNILLLIFIAIPCRWRSLHCIRQLAALIAASALAYYESYLPSFSALTANDAKLTDFSLSFVADFLASAINLYYVAAVAITGLLFLILQPYIRFTTVTLILVIFMCFQPAIISYWRSIFPVVQTQTSTTLHATGRQIQQAPRIRPAAEDYSVDKNAQPQFGAPAVTGGALTAEAETYGELKGPVQNRRATPENIERWLEEFYSFERSRRIRMPLLPERGFVPFDIVMLSICSLGYSDLQESGLDSHPLFTGNDLTFTNFNTATSYTGPAVLRLLNSLCGQPPHDGIYDNRRECQLSPALSRLGYHLNLLMDHDGVFGNYLSSLSAYGGLQAQLNPQNGYSQIYQSFHQGGVIYDSQDVLSDYLRTVSQHSDQPNFTFINFVALHDGNLLPQAADDSLTPTQRWTSRARRLFDDLLDFEESLQRSGRRVMVIFVPEHGAAMRGDKIQMARLRDIPGENLTRVPVYVKFINREQGGTQLEISSPVSYLGLSSLIAQAVQSNFFADSSNDMQHLAAAVETTYRVSENQQAVVVNYQGQDYLKLQNSAAFTVYPQ